MRNRLLCPLSVTLLLAGLAGAAPIETIPLPTPEDPNPLVSDGLANAAANRVVTFTPTATGTVRRVLLNGTLFQVTGTGHEQARVTITPPGGAAIDVIPFRTGLDDLTPQILSGFQVAVPPTVANAGVWTVRFSETSDQTGSDAEWTDFSIVLDDEVIAPPAFEDIGTLTPGLTVRSGPISTVGDVRWYRFTLATGIDSTQGTFLDIDSEGSLLTGTNATELGLFRADGTIVATDTIDGSGSLSQLSFGAGFRPPFETSAAYNGRDGSTGNQIASTLAAGTYFLAVADAGVSYQAGFNAPPDPVDTDTGDVTVRLALGGGLTPPACPAGTANVSFTNVASNGTDTGAAAAENTILTHTFAVPPGFTTQTIRVSGQITTGVIASNSTDNVRIGILPPGVAAAQEIRVTPISSTTTRLGTHNLVEFTFNIAAGPVNGVGQWRFRFYESSNQTGVDNVWNNVCISVQQFVPPAPPAVFADLGTLPTNGAFVSAATAVSGNPAEQPAWFRFMLSEPIDRALFSALDIDTEGSNVTETRIGLYSAAGTLLINDDDDGSGDLAQISVGALGTRFGFPFGLNYTGRDSAPLPIPANTLPAGTYYVAVTSGDTGVTFGGGFDVVLGPTAFPQAGTVVLRARHVTNFVQETPAVVQDLGTLAAGAFTLTTPVIPPGGVVWYRFTLPTAVNTAENNFLDIDTQDSEINAELGLFLADGNDVTTDDDTQGGGAAQLSHGVGTRPNPFGTDYGGADPDLAAGVYYLAVGAGSGTTFSTSNAFDVTSTDVDTGTVRLNFNFNTIQPGTPPAVFTDVVLANPGTFTANVELAAREVRWFRVTIPEIDAAARTYLDIDTEGSTAIDPEITLYRPDGVVEENDDTSGSGTTTVPPDNAALSFGRGIRPAVGDGLRFTGQDGAVLPAGVYWLAVAEGELDSLNGWASASAGTGGMVTINIRVGTQPPTPPPASTDLGVLADTSTTQQTFSLAENEVRWFTFTLANPIDRALREFLDIDTEGSTLAPTNATEISIFTSTGDRIENDSTDGTDSLSQISIGQGFRPAPGNGTRYDGRDDDFLEAGTYFVAVHGSSLVPGTTEWDITGTETDTGTIVLNIRTGVQPLPTPPTFVELGTIALPSTFTQSLSLGASEVRWFRMTIGGDGIQALQSEFLDLDTEGTLIGTPVTTTTNATEVSVYNAAGVRVSNDLSDGSSSLSQISYGRGTRAAVRTPPSTADSALYNGRDGDLAPGVYFIAVSGSGLSHNASDFDISGTEADTGTITLNLRAGVEAPATPPTVNEALGVISASNTPLTRTINVLDAQVVWYSFTLPADVSAAGGTFLDIDTEGTALVTGNFTELILFNDTGLVLSSDLVDGSASLSQLSFGAGTRPAVGGAAYDGRDGDLPAGTYYLAAGGTTITENDGFLVPSSNTDDGPLVVNIRTNVAGGPAGCNVADIVSIGGFPPADGELTVDDYTSFINAFAGDELLADIVSIGGFPPSDGELTVDDYTSFINAFAEGC